MKILIIGAREDGHAKVVLEIVLAMGTYTLSGFIDDDPDKKDKKIRGFKILGGINELKKIIKKYQIKGAIVAIGDNTQRRKLAQLILKNKLTLINAIHPTVHLDSDVIMGNGNVLCQGVIIVTGTKIGNCVNIHTGATIDHDNVLEDGSNIGPGTHTAGRVKIGKDAFLGTGVSVIPDITIGEGAIIGAGSVVIRNVPSFTKVVGVPAKKM